MTKTNSHFRIPAHASLIVRSMVSILLLLTLIVGGASTLTVMEMKQNAQEQLEQQSAYISKITTQATALSVWNFDTAQAQQQLDALQGADNFCGARILGANGAIFANAGFPSALNGSQYLHRTDIAFDNPNNPQNTMESIGSLELCISTTATEKRVQSAITQQLIFFGLIAVAMMTAGYISLQIITRPLRHIREAMEQVARTMEPISDNTLLKQNEIGALAHSFNLMVFDLSRTYQQLTETKERAVKADNAKSEFLANISHELRTPLNNIIGIIQILDSRGMNAEQREMLGMVRKSSQTLLHIVNDILDISKIEAGEMKLEAIAFDVAERLRHTVNTMKPMASRKGFNLDCQMAEGPLPVIGDPVRFERILTNLLSNAIRYTQKGSVRVAAKIAADISDPAKIMLQVRVIDTGIGIPKDKQGVIFEKFIQADNSDTRRYGGTGLGLTITRELVEMMDGKIGVESEVGKGSTFWFDIPFTLAPALPEEREDEYKDTQILYGPQGAIPVSEVRILIAEDHEMNQVFMRKLLGNLGIENFTIVDNGRKAVEILEEQNFDLVLMDCHMPEMNGYDATIAIRRLPDGIAAEIPIIAMTANAMARDEERCLAIGMNDYLSKPFEVAEFKRKLSPWVAFAATPEDSADIADAHEIPANMDLLNASSMGDKAYIQTMLELFMTTADEQITSLESNSHDGVSQPWIEVSHSLKGTAGVVGATRLLRLAAEAQAMENATAKARTEKAAALRAEYNKVRKYLIQAGFYAEAA